MGPQNKNLFKRVFHLFGFRPIFPLILSVCFVFLTLFSLVSPVCYAGQPTVTVYDQFTNFETEPVKPLALSHDKKHLFALNTADDRLEVFAVQKDGLRSIGEAFVGLRPVAIAVPGNDEVWVANHLSDAVSILDVKDPTQPRLVRTIQVGDEPRGIVAAGPEKKRVFVACAKRGFEMTPGIGRAEIWMFDTSQPEREPTVLTLFGTMPRALAASPDGRFVYASVFHSGNKTTSTGAEDAVKLGFAKEPGLFKRHKAIPKAGAIVTQRNGKWQDELGRDWSAAVPFDLPDEDIFIIDAMAAAPHIVDKISGVGTILFDIGVQPGTQTLWVANTEAANLTRHEPRLRSRFASNRITQIHKKTTRDGWRVQSIDLNPHIDHSVPTGNSSERKLSLAQPAALAFHPNGREAYVAAFGSGKVGVLNNRGQVIDRIDVGFGPGGLAIDPDMQRLYVHNHLEASLSVVNLVLRKTIATIPLRNNPTPQVIQQGRPLLYDASLTSGHGDLSCATCHVFGDMDGLAWDLGDPEGDLVKIPSDIKHPDFNAKPLQLYHPLKGPMMTQSLRGLANSAPYHWRGDRFGSAADPGHDIPSFMTFNPTYVNLLGRAAQFSDARMEAFAKFTMTIHYPPNPNQSLDRSLSLSEQAGFDFFDGPFLVDNEFFTCIDCHALPFGTNRKINFEGDQVGRDMKASHFRNVYQKVGRFNVNGPQVSGFGLLHDGSVDTVVNFLKGDIFIFPGDTEKAQDKIRLQLNDYVMAFDTGMAPVVGRQITLRDYLSEQIIQEINFLIERTAAGDCDFVAHGLEAGGIHGWLYREGKFIPDQSHLPPLNFQGLVKRYGQLAEPLTFTCIPPGDGHRTALDRDLNGIRNGDQHN